MTERKSFDRRAFLKFTGISLATGLSKPLLDIYLDEEERERRELLVADRIPIIEYHNPTFKMGDVYMDFETFEFQMNYLGERGFKALTDKELTRYLAGEGLYPIDSVVLRFDEGIGGKKHQWEWQEQIIPLLRKNNLHGIVFVLPDAIKDDLQNGLSWQELASWHNEGFISIGSHSVSHPDFRKISSQRALWEAKVSKQAIEKKMREAEALDFQVYGFAYPYDGVPEETDFLEKADYKFALGGRLGSDNSSVFLEDKRRFSLPTLMPYKYKPTEDTLARFGPINPLILPLTGGLTFGQMLETNMTPVTYEMIGGQKVKLAYDYKELEQYPNPGVLIKPRMIVVSFSETQAPHFIVNKEKITQTLPAYQDDDGRLWFQKGEADTAVLGEAILIDGIDPKMGIAAMTQVISSLLKQADITLENVFGGFEVNFYMPEADEVLFIRNLKERLRLLLILSDKRYLKIKKFMR